MTTSQLLTKKEAADLLKCSVKHLQRLIDDGVIMVVCIGESKRCQRIEQSEIEAYVKSNRVNQATRRYTWQSKSAAKSGTLHSSSTGKQLDALLG